MKQAENERKKINDGLPNVTLTFSGEHHLPSTLRVNFGFDWDSLPGDSKTVDFRLDFSKIADKIAIFSNSVIILLCNVFTLTNYEPMTHCLTALDPGAESTKIHAKTDENTMQSIIA